MHYFVHTFYSDIICIRNPTRRNDMIGMILLLAFILLLMWLIYIDIVKWIKVMKRESYKAGYRACQEELGSEDDNLE